MNKSRQIPSAFLSGCWEQPMTHSCWASSTQQTHAEELIQPPDLEGGEECNRSESINLNKPGTLEFCRRGREGIKPRFLMGKNNCAEAESINPPHSKLNYLITLIPLVLDSSQGSARSLGQLGHLPATLHFGFQLGSREEASVTNQATRGVQHLTCRNEPHFDEFWHQLLSHLCF